MPLTISWLPSFSLSSRNTTLEMKTMNSSKSMSPLLSSSRSSTISLTSECLRSGLVVSRKVVSSSWVTEPPLSSSNSSKILRYAMRSKTVIGSTLELSALAAAFMSFGRFMISVSLRARNALRVCTRRITSRTMRLLVYDSMEATMTKFFETLTSLKRVTNTGTQATKRMSIENCGDQCESSCFGSSSPRRRSPSASSGSPAPFSPLMKRKSTWPYETVMTVT
mmetsp:Transcript_26263/g.70024  ORF Transcript_26263/g.70024 Transcript_26263/m.70024 type:complete len:223 (+) Transcript_26263:537-1205(+)